VQKNITHYIGSNLEQYRAKQLRAPTNP